MNVHEKIRLIRELKHLSQEDVAEQLNISTSGYAKIERGESQLNLYAFRTNCSGFKHQCVGIVEK